MTDEPITPKPTEEQPPSFESILGELEALVARLEEGNLPLEESLQVFERGMTLARTGTSLLETAEQKVEVLLREENGELCPKPFDPSQERE